MLRRTAALDRSIKEVARARAQRELGEVQARLKDLTLVAPRDGILLIAMSRQDGRKILVGDKLWVGGQVAFLPDLSAMRVRARLSDVDDGAVREGMAAECVFDAYPDCRFPGTVRAVSPVAAALSRDNPRRFFDVLVELGKNEPGLFRPGMSLRVAVVRRHVAEGLLFPRAAVASWPGKSFVHLAGGGERQVEIDLCTETLCSGRGEVPEGTALLPAASPGAP